MRRGVQKIWGVAFVVVVGVACAVLGIQTLVPRGMLYVQISPHATSTLTLVGVRAVEADGEVVPLDCVAPEDTEAMLRVCTKRLRTGTYPDIELVWEAPHTSTLPFPMTRAPLQYTVTEDTTTAVLIGVDTERSRVALSSGGEVLLPFVSVEVREHARVGQTGDVSGGTVLHSMSMGTDRFGVLRQNVRTPDLSLTTDTQGRLQPVILNETPAETVPVSDAEDAPTSADRLLATSTDEGEDSADIGTSSASTILSDTPTGTR